MPVFKAQKIKCTHCGEDCNDAPIYFNDKEFCCSGCKMVYQLLSENDLCEYYNFNQAPGINQQHKARKDKFSFLDDTAIAQKLISFKDDIQTYVTFYLPQMHCSSCLYLLENLHRINNEIVSTKVEFTKRELHIIFNNSISLRSVAELLTSIGYEPYISLNNLNNVKQKVQSKSIYQVGIAGFCFANIMLLSFPEYLGLNTVEPILKSSFRILNVLLSLPVILYSAQPFFYSAYTGLKHKYLNIDAPISLAIIVTFGRSLFEIITQTGAGYFDSMSGIVFFMLVGRILQDKTYQQLSFDRDFTSYFPIAIDVIKGETQVPTQLPNIQPGDTILIHNEELIPTDGILTKGKANIDYSFVTGESTLVEKEMGEIVYAGGKQIGSNIEILVMKEVTQSYLTSLWSNKSENRKDTKPENHSFIHLISHYFTYIVFGIATISAIYWGYIDSSKIWNVVTAILIIACPCALLLSSTLTEGNILKILGLNNFYLKNAGVIDSIAKINHIVFDKTGTLTTTNQIDIEYEGKPLSGEIKSIIKALCNQSTHPLCKMLNKHLVKYKFNKSRILQFKEISGKGIQGIVNEDFYSIGSFKFITGSNQTIGQSTNLFIAQNNKILGQFVCKNHYRDNISDLFNQLSTKYKVSVISGDSSNELRNLEKITNNKAELHFNQSPQNKKNYINNLQSNSQQVMMVGDGLNDSGALLNSRVGVAITEDCNNFTPASDAILKASQIIKLPAFLKLCIANKIIIFISFIFSLLYNIIGLYFATQGNLSPLIAAVLMPASSISILIITFCSSNSYAKYLGLATTIS